MADIYSSFTPIKTDQGVRYYKNAVFPEIPYSDNDIYVITTVGDRLDLLAYDYYGDPELWKIIASANALPCDSLFITPGTQIRIPANLNNALIDINSTNK